MFFKMALCKYFPNFTGKHLCWSLFLIKLQAFRPLYFNTCVILRNLRISGEHLFKEHLRWLLLPLFPYSTLHPARKT